MMIPANIAITGRDVEPCTIAKEIKIPDSAPVGPIILKWLPPSNAPINPAQRAVMIPCTGVAPEAMAKAKDRGMLIHATVKPDFQLCFKLFLRLRVSIK